MKWRVRYDNCNNCNWNAVFVNHWHSSVCIYFITFQLLQLSFIYQAKAISSTGNIFCKTLWHNDIWCFYDKLTKCKLLICMNQKKQVFCFFPTSGNRAEILSPRRYSRRVWRRVFSFGFPSGFLRVFFGMALIPNPCRRARCCTHQPGRRVSSGGNGCEDSCRWFCIG